MENEHNVQNTETTAEPEKTFTQAEVDALITKRLDRERKKYPSEDEMTEFKAWKESQQTEKERWDALTGERDTARTALAAAEAELEQMKREKYLTGKGVPDSDLDYYSFKIGKMVDDSKSFEQAAEEFLAANAPSKVRVDMTAPLDSGKNLTVTANESMNALIRGAIN